ncbi:MAG: hypothetical protein J4F42_02180 [Desulfurellaceae bacterium]|nr:hypothetical protein [Desulfurellaceae bacterium]
MQFKALSSVLVHWVFTLSFLGLSEAEPLRLGSITFPNSGPAAAQEDFLRGVKYLHSFGFEEAAEAFRAASKIAPDFALAYWGEALSYNHPLQPERDLASPRRVLARLGPSPAERVAKAPSAREAGLLEAVEILYGAGSAAERSLAYSRAMGRLAAHYPDDEEIQAFYAVALLGTVRHIGESWGAESTYRVRMQAGALAQDIFRTHPDHPGAAHYIIHAFDDPVHAPLALTAAERYAEIAPDVSHALHMPSHIFIQHGMWDKVVASNDASYQAAIQLWQKRADFSDTKRYFSDSSVWHALDWGQYGALQQADYVKARQTLALLRPVAAESQVSRVKEGVGVMAARYIVESEQWEKLAITDTTASAALLATGLSAVRLGDIATAEQVEARLKTLAEEKHPSPRLEKSVAIMHKEIAALVRLARGKSDAAIALMQEATALAQDLGLPNGAAIPIKPAHELYGEILLELGRPQEAMAQFEASLLRMPNRALSLRGLARAAAQSGDTETARQRYTQLVQIWESRGTPEVLQEAQGFLKEQAS